MKKFLLTVLVLVLLLVVYHKCRDTEETEYITEQADGNFTQVGPP